MGDPSGLVLFGCKGKKRQHPNGPPWWKEEGAEFSLGASEH